MAASPSAMVDGPERVKVWVVCACAGAAMRKNAARISALSA